MKKQQKTCKDQVNSACQSRMEDIYKLWEMYQKDPDQSDEELGDIYEYGLSFDYVAARTFKGQKRGFFRYQLSTGGPQEEFRFFIDENHNPYKIEFWFLDWYDGAKKILSGYEFVLMDEIFNWFKECGAVNAELEKAGKNYCS